MHLQITGYQHELDKFLRDFQDKLGGHIISHDIDWFTPCTPATCAGYSPTDGHVHVGIQVAESPQEVALPSACQERVWLDGIAPTTCGRTLVDGQCGRHGRIIGGTVAEIAQRLVESGAVAAVMAPDGRVYAPGDVTLVGPADGPQEPSRVTYVDDNGVEHDITNATIEYVTDPQDIPSCPDQRS